MRCSRHIAWPPQLLATRNVVAEKQKRRTPTRPSLRGMGVAKTAAALMGGANTSADAPLER